MIVLTHAERTELLAISNAADVPVALQKRARAILAAAAGQTHSSAARAIGVSRQTILRWLHRFTSGNSDRVGSLFPQQQRRPAPDNVYAPMYDFPKTAVDWSSRTAARELSIPRTTLQRKWRNAGIQLRDFGVCPDSLRLDNDLDRRVFDVGGVYLQSLNNAIVFVAEPRIRYSSTVRDCRRDQIRARAALFLDAITLMETQVLGWHTLYETFFIEFLGAVEREYPGLELHLVCDSGHDTFRRSTAITSYIERRPITLHQVPLMAVARPWPRWVQTWLDAICTYTRNPDALVNAYDFGLHLPPSSDVSLPRQPLALFMRSRGSVPIFRPTGTKTAAVADDAAL